MEIKDCFKVGYVAKTHGLKGEVTIVFSDALAQRITQSLWLEVNGSLVPYFIETISDRGDQAFVKFEDVSSPEQAKALKGCSVYLSRKSRPTLARSEFYDDEVLGFQVEDTTVGPLGTIRQVIQVGPNRLLSVDYQNKEVLIPVNGPFIKSLNRSRKKMTVELPAGFLDI